MSYQNPRTKLLKFRQVEFLFNLAFANNKILQHYQNLDMSFYFVFSHTKCWTPSDRGHFDKERGHAQGLARASTFAFLAGRIELSRLDYQLARFTSGGNLDLAGQRASLRWDSQLAQD